MNSWLKFYLASREEKNMQRNSKKTNDSKEAELLNGVNRWICAILEFCTMIIEIPDLIGKSVKKNTLKEDFGCDC